MANVRAHSDRTQHSSWDLPRVTLVFGIPIVVFVAVLTMLVAEGRKVEGVLQLFMAREVVAGEWIGIRAVLFENIDGPRGPELSTARTRVELTDTSGHPVSRTNLLPADKSMEGELRIPTVEGTLRLRAFAQLQSGKRVTVEFPIKVSRRNDDVKPTAVTIPRVATPLQRFSQMPVQVMKPEGASARLKLRIAGGVCVPELPCELLVYVGDSDYDLDVEPTKAFTPRSSLPRTIAAHETASLKGVAHGPEASLTLYAKRAGVTVASREVRLAIALGSMAIEVESPMVEPNTRVVFSIVGASAGRLFIDAFQDGRWLRAGSVSVRSTSASQHRLPFVLEPGLWRVHAYTDPLSRDNAAVRVVYVRKLNETREEAMAQMVSRHITGNENTTSSGTIGLNHVKYVFAEYEEDVIPLPSAMSSLPADEARISSNRWKSRAFGFVALILCAALAGTMLWRRGVTATAEADDVLAMAGGQAAPRTRHRLFRTLSVVALAIAFSLVFILIAIFLLTFGSQ